MANVQPLTTKLFDVLFGENQTSFAGQAKTFKAPDVSEKLEEHRGAAMLGTIELKQGLEKLEASIVLTDYNAVCLREVGVVNGTSTWVTLRGSIENDQDPDKAIPVEHVMLCNVSKSELNDFEEGSVTELTITLTSIKQYSHKIDNKEVQFVDIPNEIWRVNGFDRYAKHRTNIGH
jgi:uncharacterized protein